LRIGVSKRERLDLILRRLEEASPFSTCDEARLELETIMRGVEDELSGTVENPDAATSPTDGRMYPPSDDFEISSGSPHVRTFKQLRHRTSFGDNGAIKITRPDGTVEIDLPGADGRSVAELI
jgi:hypothetical protein